MAPIPYTPNARMVFTIVVSGVAHELTVGVEVEVDGLMPGGYAVTANDVGGSHLDPATVAAEWWSYVKALYATGTGAALWELQLYFPPVFVPVVGGTCAGGGGTGGGNQLTMAATVTFKDSSNIRVNFQFPEGSTVSPLRNTHALASLAIAAFSTSVLDTNTPGELGYWMKSRGSNVIALPRLATCSQNRRLRKIRGYA